MSILLAEAVSHPRHILQVGIVKQISKQSKFPVFAVVFQRQRPISCDANISKICRRHIESGGHVQERA